MLKNSYFVYVLVNKKNGVIYIGVTNDLYRRVFEHKQSIIPGFTQKYHVSRLVYYEFFDNVEDAIYREKCLKEWRRQWKIELIEKQNPHWEDLFLTMC